MKPLLIILILSYPLVGLASDPKVDSLKKLGRTALINLAVSRVDDRAFDPSQYDRITVKASEHALIVEFALSVTFENDRACFYDAVVVALAGDGSGKSITGNCDEPAFYRSTPRIQRKIAFVFRAINRTSEIGDVDNFKLPSTTRMHIRQRGIRYDVRTDSWSTMSVYRVNRVTGKITRATHKHYARSAYEKEIFEIIQ